MNIINQLMDRCGEIFIFLHDIELKSGAKSLRLNIDRERKESGGDGKGKV